MTMRAVNWGLIGALVFSLGCWTAAVDGAENLARAVAHAGPGAPPTLLAMAPAMPRGAGHAF